MKIGIFGKLTHVRVVVGVVKERWQGLNLEAENQ